MHSDSIWWAGYNRPISKYPKTFCSFITKQVSGWCGCNSKWSLWEDNIINKCPQCRLEHENSKHLTRCRDPGQLLQLHKSIESIMDDLDDANVASELTKMIKTYLLNQGRWTMGDCTQPNSIFSPIAVDTDKSWMGLFCRRLNPTVIYHCNQTDVHTIQSTWLRRYMGVKTHQKSYWVDTQTMVILE